MILRRKSHNCAGTAFVQGDSAGGSKLTEQTLQNRTWLIGFRVTSSFVQVVISQNELKLLGSMEK